VSVLDQVPDFPLEIGSCVTRRLYFGQDFKTCATQPAALYEARHRILNEYFGFLQKQYSFSIASVAGLICNSETCRAYDGETLLMGDTQHLTEIGSLRAIPFLNIPLLMGPGEKQNTATVSVSNSRLSFPKQQLGR
jgi:SGNH domain (fused to AT3 domains)